jgi:hypothetical protein
VFAVVTESKFVRDPIHAGVRDVSDKQTVFDDRATAFQYINGGTRTGTAVIDKNTISNDGVTLLQATMFNGNASSAQTSRVVNNSVVLDGRARTPKDFDRTTIGIEKQCRLQSRISS